MYAYIKGELVAVNEDHVVIDISGIGYEIVCSHPNQFTGQLNQEIKVYTYYYVREDLQLLYGFKQIEEKDLFKKLLNVSGIGPKNALNIVGQTTVSEFAVAIENEDESYLTKFPGVGKKTARQMILDLKGKVDEWLHLPHHNQTSTHLKDNNQAILDEAIQALKALGYTPREINAVSQKLRLEDAMTTDDLVKKGLQLLMRN
ncbi:Holliday junction branch migration protein RuvA [Bacillaceae bacterium W0354]